MPHFRPTRGTLPRRSERGVVLIIALIVLVLITIVSVMAIRSTTTDERLASNARDRDKAFQAAEAAVRACLQAFNGGSVPAGLRVLTPTASPNPPVWEVADNWDASSTNSYEVPALGTTSQAGLATLPRCMVEQLNATPASYRVTGRAVGASADTVVMLQATLTEE
jgi:type IV pilus assembly protein PilX